MFTTAAEPSDATRYVTRHEPETWYVEMIKITPEVTARRLTIQLRAPGAGSEADVTFAHTSLGPRVNQFVASCTEEFYRAFMQDWESRLNHLPEHGSEC